MNFKDFGLREWLVIIFIILGLAAFVFEDYFKPKIYEAEGVGIGYNDDITLKVKAYKKKDKTIRVTEIEVKHGDTDEIGGVALQKLVDDVKDISYIESLDGYLFILTRDSKLFIYDENTLEQIGSIELGWEVSHRMKVIKKKG